MPCATLGANLTYTLTASTLSNVAATGVVITDTIPANTTYVTSSNGGTFTNGVVTFPAFALNGTSMATRTITVAVAATVPAGVTTITNVASIHDDGTHGADSNTSNNTFTLSTPICTTQNTPDTAAITKSVNVPCATLGTNLTYTLTASTLNAVSSTGIVVTDTLPANTTYVTSSNGGTFANGVVSFPAFALSGNSTATRTITVAVAATVPAGVASLVNVATITDDGTHGPDSNTSNNTFTLTTPICTQQNPPDLAITKSVPVPCATLGTNLTYTLVATSQNANAATGVVVTDTLPANTTFVSASNGGTFANGIVTFPAFALSGNSTAIRTVTVAVAASVPAGVTSLINICSVTDDHSNGPDVNPNDNTYTLTTPICSQNTPDLAITKSIGVPCATLGSNLTYTLTASNLSSVGATGVVIADTIPANTTYVTSSNGGIFSNGIMSFPAFALGGTSTATRTITVAVAATVPTGVTAISNNATISDDGTHGTDSNLSNNSFTLTTPICTTQTGNDLSIAINSSHVCANLVDTYTYTLKVANANGNALTGVVVTDTIPPNSTFVSASDGGTLNTTTGVVTFPTFNLPEITTVIRTVTVKVTLPLVPPAVPISLTNTASVHDDGTNGADVNPANNTATVTVLESNLHFVSDPSGEPNPVVLGVPESFSALAQDDANPNVPITYSWNFGDGTTGTGASVTHTYPTNLTGPFTITLTVPERHWLSDRLHADARQHRRHSSGGDVRVVQGAVQPGQAQRGQPEPGCASHAAQRFQNGRPHRHDRRRRCRSLNQCVAVNESYRSHGGTRVAWKPLCDACATRFSLVKPNADSLNLVAQVTLPNGFKTAGHTVTIAVASFSFTATLDKNGNGVGLPNNEHVKVKANGTFSIVSLKITKSNLRTLLAPGVPPTALTASVPQQVFVISFDQNGNADSFGIPETINYKSNGKTGVISF